MSTDVSRWAFWSLAGRFAQSLVMLAGTMALARLLAPADFGVLAITQVTLLCVFVLLEGFVEYPLVRARTLSGDTQQSVVWVGLLISVAAASLVFMLAPLSEGVLGFEGSATVLRAIAPIMLIQGVAVAGRALLRRRERFVTVARALVVASISYVTVAIVAGILGFGYWSLIAGQAVSYAMMALQFGWLSKLSLRFPLKFQLTGLGSVLLAGGGMRFLAWFWSQIDTIAIMVTMTSAATGIYTRAYNLSAQAKEPFLRVDHPLRQAMIVARDRGDSVQSVEKVAVKYYRLLMMASGLCAAVLIVLRDSAILILLGPQWDAAALPFAILAAALPARVARMFLDSKIIAHGRMQSSVLYHLVLCLLIGSSVAVAVHYGMVAVAAVVTASLYVSLLVPVARLHEDGIAYFLRYARAAAPGLALGVGFVALFELVVAPMANEVIFALTAFAAWIILIFSIVMLSPDNWLPSWALAIRRRPLVALRARIGQSPVEPI